MSIRWTLLLATLMACTTEPYPEGAYVWAIVDKERSTHFFDWPFPSDEMLDDAGHPILTGFPVPPSDITQPVIAGWVAGLETSASGFSNNGSAYFRFDGPLKIPEVLEGKTDDPVLLIDLETGERIPLMTRFTTDPGDDPFLAENLLAIAPALGYPPRSGATLVAVVMQSAGVVPAQDWTADPSVEIALQRAGVSGSPAVATTFTVQDATGQLRQLAADVDARIGSELVWGDVSWKRVVSISYNQGLTESGEAATLATATYADGSSGVAYLYAHTIEEAEHTTDLLNDWPMAVFEAEIPVLNYSGLDDQPYMSPGVGHLFDASRTSGRIAFENGVLATVPDLDTMRVVLSLPKDAAGVSLDDTPLIMYDHGTGGHAYNSVQRLNVHDDCRALAQVYADAGYGVIGRDAPLYGTRFPLIDAGFSGGSLGFYNVVNLPAFRDNERQTAVEGHILLRFIEDRLNTTLTEGSVDPSRIRRFGHSLGSVTANLGLAIEPEAFESALLSGTGGVMSHYFLDTGLISDMDPSFFPLLFGLFNAEVPAEVTAAAAMGAALGLPQSAWDGIDRLHPVISLFQWTMDPGDSASVARDETLPTTIIVHIDDHQVPNFTSHALATAQPDASVVTCTPLWEYDPHYCMHREVEGHGIMADWLAE
jgi:hypothetical protein